MRANELRIGNWIMEDYWRQIELQDFEPGRYFDEGNDYDNDKIEPIPLTPEILEKCGFKKGLEGFRFNGGVEINFDEDLLAGFSHCEIKYVHQLQNLYFALTGEELRVNL